MILTLTFYEPKIVTNIKIVAIFLQTVTVT